MIVENRITRIFKRESVVVPFDQERIANAIYRASVNSGVTLFHDMEDLPPAISDQLFGPYKGLTEREIARRLSDDVVLCLNADARNTNPTRPPHVETIQDVVEHVLASRGFIGVAEMYRVYRWGRAKVRQGEILDKEFAGHGFPRQACDAVYAWNAAHHCETIDRLNDTVRDRKRYKALVDAAIAEFEEDLDEAATLFLGKKKVRVMIITGPSSSGKTTTTRKLCARLEKEGISFLALNIDNYFWDLQEHPRDGFGDYDYETPQALDLYSINQDVARLLEGGEAIPPYYNFKTGKRDGRLQPLRLEKGQVLLLDSHYGLFPPMTSRVPSQEKFELFIETLNMQKEGDGTSNRLVKFTDLRMLRRMLRDRDHRSHPVDRTLGHWHYVRRGELKDIIPYIYASDYLLNGAFPFELPILRQRMGDAFPDPERFRTQNRLDAYIRGVRVKRLLDSVLPQEDLSYDVIPSDCVVREFIGGSSLDVW
jgi:uridine kinase